MLIKEAHHQFQRELSTLYDQREASSIADAVMEEITGWSRSQRIVHFDAVLDAVQLEKWETSLEELKSGRPLQYVLGYTWFSGMKFHVDERVLIPRPETEELVQSISNQYMSLHWEKGYTPRMLDIGTGSGCIAIALKKRFPEWEVHALDKSTTALALARENSILLNTPIHWHETDILREAKIDHLPSFDLIVSNPPYILPAEQKEMSIQVIDHEPHLALFTQENDPLQFYKAIVEFSHHHLLRGGYLWFETHMDHAGKVAALLEEHEFEKVRIKQDMQGRDRIVHGKRSGTSL